MDDVSLPASAKLCSTAPNLNHFQVQCKVLVRDRILPTTEELVSEGEPAQAEENRIAVTYQTLQKTV